MNRRHFIAALPAAGIVLAQDATPDLSGNWEGALITPGAKFRLVLDVSKASDGLYIGTLTSLDQGGAKIPIETIRVNGTGVHLEMKASGESSKASWILPHPG